MARTGGGVILRRPLRLSAAPRSSSSSASSSTGTPSSLRLGELGAGLRARDEVAGLLRDARRRPSRRARAGASCASSRVSVASVPVSTKVLPASGSAPARRCAAAGPASAHPARCKALMTRRCSAEAKNAATCAATIGPTSGTCSMLAASASSALERAEMARERQRRGLAHFADPEPEKQPRQRRVACCARWRRCRFAADFSPMRSSCASCCRRRGHRYRPGI